MRSSRDYPFNKLALPAGEVMLYQASNPTFHRTGDYGLVVTQLAFYWYSPFWLWLSRWRRYALENIESVQFVDSRWFPKLIVRAAGRNHVLRTPYDTYTEDMHYDRQVLREAAVFVEMRRGARSEHSPTISVHSKRDH